MLSIRIVFLMTFSLSNIGIAASAPHATHQLQHQHQNEDCPVCLESPSSNDMMCENGHSMGCESCVEAIAAKAVADGVEPRCPLCRKTFDLVLVKENSPRILRDLEAKRVAQQQQEQPVAIDREAIRRMLIDEERQYVLRELGEQGRQRIRAEHLQAIKQAIRNSFTPHEVSEAKEQERREIIQNVRAELKRQEENSIRQQQRALLQTGQIVLIDVAERAAIEQSEFHRMQDEERGHIRRARRNQIQSEGIQLITAAERESIMQNVLAQMQEAEREKKAQALNSRRQNIAYKFWLKNGLVWLSNCVPLINVGYYNYDHDVEQELRQEEINNPA